MEVLDIINDIETRAKDAGITVEKLCADAGVARSTLARIKAGKQSPTYRTIKKLRDAIPGEVA